MQKCNALLISFMIMAFSLGQAQAETVDLTISGQIDTDISMMSSDSNGDSSDISVSTLELGIAAQLSEPVDVSITILQEDIGTDDQTAFEIDTAEINMVFGNSKLTIGQTTIPFGRYDTGVISYPLTRTLGETADNAVIYSREQDSGLGLSAYLFNGDVDDGDDAINDFGFSLRMEQANWSLGVDYISNLGDSDTLGELTNPAVDDDVAAVALGGTFTSGNLSFSAEHVRALDTFGVGDAAGLKPAATHLEVGLDIGDDRFVALSLSASDDANGLLDYETQVAVAYNTTVLQQVGLSVEAMSAKEYNDNRDLGVTLQLSVQF